MAKEDPYEDDPPHTYECQSCGERIEAENHPGDCPNCNGQMQNISKPREK